MAFNPNDHLTNKAYSAAVADTVLDVTTDANALIYGMSVTELSAAVGYLQVFDVQSGDVTLGTTVPDWYIAVPASGNVVIEFTKPIKHTTGFSIAATTTATGNTAGSCSVMIHYGSKA